jgi:hypothetical protein
MQAMIKAEAWGEVPISRIPPGGHLLMATSKININSKFTYENESEITAGG